MGWKQITCVAAIAAIGCGEVEQANEATTAVTTAIEQPIRAPQPAALSSHILPDERLHYVSIPGGNFAETLTRGHRVDLVALIPIEAAETDQSSHVVLTLVQNVTVLDVEASDGGVPRVGLALTSSESAAVGLAENAGEVHALLRNPGDSDVDVLTRTTLREALADVEITQEKRQLRNRTGEAALDPAMELAKSVRVGERALSIAHDLPPGRLVPGDRVDLSSFFTESAIAMTLLQDVAVLGDDGSRVVLSVTPDEARLLLVAATAGRISLGLRNPEDREISTITKTTLREVLEDLEVIQEKRQIRVRRRPKSKRAHLGIEIIRGDGGGGHAPTPVVAATNTESYTDHGTNPFTATSEDRFSTFGIDVDTGSYTIARRKIREGQAPPAASVRVEEWLNYFDYEYPAPRSGAFSVSLEAAPSPFQTSGNYRLLRVGVQGKTIAAKDRKPVHLTFLVDTSGSMNSDDKLGLAQKALRHLVQNLRPADTVAIATYAGSTEVLLQPTAASNSVQILQAIDRLRSGGGTAMNDGLALAYGLAAANMKPDHESRVIVLSDGDANIGATGWQAMLATIADKVKQGVTLSTIGFGMGNYQDSAMEQLANRGNGNYFYIDSDTEARKVFGQQLDGTLQTIAKDVKIQVEFDPRSVQRYRLIGYENRDIADTDFRNDKVDAGEIGAGHSVTALYELEMTQEPVESVATVRVRHKEPRGTGAAREAEFQLGWSSVAHRLADASDSFRFAASVAAFAEVARQSRYAAALNHDWVIEVASAATGGREDREEFVQLVKVARLLH